MTVGRTKILFLSDGSLKAEKAIRFGAWIARACQAEPSILGVADNPDNKDNLLEALRQSQKFFSERHLETQLLIEVGPPVKEIVKHCKKNLYDLVVMGAVRRSNIWKLFDPLGISGRIFKILESVNIPVLLVMGDRPGLRRIILCSSGSDYIDKALKFTGDLAQCTKAVVDLFHVMPDTPAMYADLFQIERNAERVLESNSRLGRTLRHQKEQLEQFGVFGEIRLRQGQVLPELLKELGRKNYDLVVVGASAMEDTLRRFVMSDVTRDIINRVKIPVLVIRTKQRLLRRLFNAVRNRLFGDSAQTSSDGSRADVKQA